MAKNSNQGGGSCLKSYIYLDRIAEKQVRMLIKATFLTDLTKKKEKRERRQEKNEKRKKISKVHVGF